MDILGSPNQSVTPGLVQGPVLSDRTHHFVTSPVLEDILRVSHFGVCEHFVPAPVLYCPGLGCAYCINNGKLRMRILAIRLYDTVKRGAVY